MLNELPLLSLAIWLPILGGLIILTLGDARVALVRLTTLAIALATFLLSIPLYTHFDLQSVQMQFVESTSWIEAFNINYSLGIDGFALPLILLTTFITVVIVIASWSSVKDRISQYFAAFLILEGLMIGVFSALDAILFYVFFEGMLIPMYLIIGIWGGPRRVYASMKFFLYTFLGSVFLLLGLIYLYIQGGSFAIIDMQQLPLDLNEQTWLFLAFLAAFAVKIPMWPVHTWLPDAHVEAPTGGSVVLAAVMLKIGGYGFLRFSLPIMPDASMSLSWLVIALSLIAIVYIGFVALAQTDMKKLIAYSSISHMGFVTLGLFIPLIIFANDGTLSDQSGAAMGIEGAMVQMISHGFISGAMFLCIGVLYDRMHTRDIADYGGVANVMPWFSVFMVLFAMANAGLPGTSGFVGEFMVILASFKANMWYAFLAALTLILGAAYTLFMVKRVLYGSINNAEVEELKDINFNEALVLGLLAFMVLLIGVWPNPLLEVLHPATEQLINHLMVSKL